VKSIYLIILFIVINTAICCGQIAHQKFRYIVDCKQLSLINLKTNLSQYDFSKLFTQTDNSEVYGFIGKNYNRLRVKIITITKDTLNSNIYNVYGKSMVNDNINIFHGYIKISKILKLRVIKHGCENDSLYQGYRGEFSIIGSYYFPENIEQNHTGIFKGSFRSDYFIDKHNHIQYDHIEDCSDGYTNNQFIGQWISNKTKIAKKCNWGDYRVPESGDLDIGAGEFSPNDKYLKFGWQSTRDVMVQSNTNLKKSKQIEEKKWWNKFQ